VTSVLVIDDDEATANIFSRMLQLEGFQVRTATSADAGLAGAEQHHPDAIFLDLRMPLVDGLEFLRRLRARSTLQRTPVVIVTGDYLIDDRTMAALDGLGAKVKFKPLWIDGLLKIATELLKSAGPSEHRRLQVEPLARSC
jgi:CheY-like chemotaxis protein